MNDQASHITNVSDVAEEFQTVYEGFPASTRPSAQGQHSSTPFGAYLFAVAYQGLEETSISYRGNTVVVFEPLSDVLRILVVALHTQ